MATQALQAGSTVLQEEPVILVREDGMDANAPINIYHAFLAASPAVQSQVLGFFSPVDTAAEGSMDRDQIER